MTRSLLTVLFVAAAALLGRLTAPESVREVTKEVRVPYEVLVAQEPDTVVKWRDRIVTKEVVVTQKVSSARPAELQWVREYCLPLTADAALVPSAAALRSVRLESSGFPWWFRTSAFRGYTIDNAGYLHEWSFQTHGSFDARVRGVDVSVRQERFWWLREIGKLAIPAGLTYLLTR